MIELNLLPEELRAVGKKQVALKFKVKLSPKQLRLIVISLISVFILTHLGISVLLTAEQGYLLRLNKELTIAAPEQKAAEELKRELDRLNKRFAMINSLASGSLIWSKKLHDLSEAMVEGVWLTSLSLSTETQQQPVSAPTPGQFQAGVQQQATEVMILKGCAVSSAAGEEAAIVGKFINSLKGRQGFFEDFDDIKLASIQRRQIGKTEVMDFTIVCYFKSGRSYFERSEASGI